MTAHRFSQLEARNEPEVSRGPLREREIPARASVANQSVSGSRWEDVLSRFPNDTVIQRCRIRSTVSRRATGVQ